MTIPAALIAEKNKIANTSAWVHLFVVTWPGGGGTSRFTANNENVTWPTTGGDVYNKAACGLGTLDEYATGELPRLSVWFHVPNRGLGPYLDASNGGKGVTVRYMMVHAGHLDLTTPVLDVTFKVTDTSEDHTGTVRFDLGIKNPGLLLVGRRMLQSFCTYREPFKGTLCAYAGTETECDRTFARCQQLSNAIHFGGFPAMGTGGVYV